MRTGVGIDTGGTYTDAVIYDFDAKTILASAKALTTKDDLAVGISNALDELPQDALQAVELVSLSTTLATNACVEGKGGRGKLIFIGADKDVVVRTGQNYGLPPAEQIFFLDGEVNLMGQIVKEPDWQAFVQDCQDWIKDADAVAVVQQLGIRNNETERKVKQVIAEQFGLNVICGYELFSDLNYIKRGASTLLNARLIPVIADFLQAIKKSLQQRKITAPVVIVRSDGSLMSEKFTTVRPVETLLCGPAASVMGGIELTGEQDCLIVDIGGTTTDMALVKGGVPVKAKDGVNVGKWQTFVKAVYVDTFGLGGDSAVRVDRHGSLSLGPARVVPFAIAAEQWPSILEKLKGLVKSGVRLVNPAYEFIFLMKDITGNDSFNQDEHALCAALKDGPLMLHEAMKAIGKRAFTPYTERLEREGVIMRCGLTPTDFMHIRGDFNRFNAEAAYLAAEYLANTIDTTVEKLTERVFDRVEGTLYFNIVRMLLEDRYPYYKKHGLDEELEKVIWDSWRQAGSGSQEEFLQLNFKTPATLVGVGAPTHIFLPNVAKALGTKYIVPDNAGVANALGAIVGNISVTKEVEIRSQFAVGGGSGYVVFGASGNRLAPTMTEAIKIASEEARLAAVAEAKRRGAAGDITVTVDTNGTEETPGIMLSATITATAVGRVLL
ncbi:MAG: hydantoinase/oxoprolinase family protein [Firmicutes bacterium]|jgi:N-methylhydantoinase A/oxoprolinase/acetone carboxylase beta subunit|nr:hydantoinase/oxoprolinase family protein [Bacillota bacterium]